MSRRDGPSFLAGTSDGLTSEKLTSKSAVPMYRWTHVALVAESSQLRMYINGALNKHPEFFCVLFCVCFVLCVFVLCFGCCVFSVCCCVLLCVSVCFCEFFLFLDHFSDVWTLSDV